MIVGIGTDIVEVERIKESISKFGDKFSRKIFTEEEINYCESYNDLKFERYAARYAAKESFAKAIGTGVRDGYNFKDIGVVNDHNGKPSIVLDGLMKEKYSHHNFHISLTHTKEYAMAYLIMTD